MKHTMRFLPWLFVLAASLGVQAASLSGAFSYQGRLQYQGISISGNYDLTFSLFGSPSGGIPVAGLITNSAVPVAGGLFTCVLDFGLPVFDGTGYWLEIGVRTNGTGGFTVLSPRQPLLAVPYAAYASSAGTANSVANLSSLYTTNASAAALAAALNVPTNASQLAYNNNSSGLSATTLQSALDQLSLLFPQPVISLPPTLYACDGHQFSIYWDTIIRDRLPLGMDWVSINPSVGSSFAAGYRWTPTVANVGTTPMNISVTWNTNSLTSWRGSLIISAQTNGSGTTRKILINGDSTSAGSGYDTLLQLWAYQNTNSGLKLNFIGTHGTSPVNHEAISGYTWARFYSGPGTPFLNASGQFDFNFYLTNHGLTMASGDWFIHKLGINDIASVTSDAAMSNLIQKYTNTLYSAVTNMQAAVPGLRVAVCVTIPPPAALDLWPWTYGASPQRYRRNRFLLAETLCTLTNWSGVSVWPIHAGLDTVNNFLTATGKVNAWNTNAFVYLNNAPHPSTSGYYQIADELWAALLAGEVGNHASAALDQFSQAAEPTRDESGDD